MVVSRGLGIGVTCSLFMLLLPVMEARTRPTPEDLQAFDHYAQVTETELNSAAAAKYSLGIDSEQEARMRDGEIVVVQRERNDRGRPIDAPKGMIQDWEGLMFVPGVTLDEFRSFLQDYDSYKNRYSPAVMESKLIGRDGDRFDVFLRLYQRTLLTVVLNVDYRVQYSFPRPGRMMIASRSTRIAGVKKPNDPDTGECEHDSGILWRLNTYWLVEAADGGVYARLEAVSLSRDAPLGLGLILKGFLTHFPKESMLTTMRQTRNGLLAERSSAVARGLQFKQLGIASAER